MNLASILLRELKTSNTVHKDVFDKLKSHFLTEEALYMDFYNYREHLEFYG